MTRPRLGPRWAIAMVVTLVAGCTGGVSPVGGVSEVSEVTGVGGSPTSTVTMASKPPPITHPPAIDAHWLPFPEPTGAVLPPPRQDALQQAMTAALDQPPPPGGSALLGLTVAVITPDGTWSGAAGVDGAGVPLTPQTMLAIGSVTKTVTAAEVLLLADRGLLDLDAPVSTYLTHPLLDRRPTISHLLSHTSGLPEYTTEAFFGDVVADPRHTWTTDQALSYATVPPTEPGGDFLRYCNTNYLFLDRLIEQVTGTPWAAAVRRDLHPHLGSRLVLQPAEQPPPPLAAPDPADEAQPDGQYLPNLALASSVAAAGGIAADATAIAEWGYHLYGGRTLSLEHTLAMATPVTFGYGLGTEIMTPVLDQTRIGHTGHINGYTALLAVHPERQLAIAALFVGPGGAVADTLNAHILTALTT